MNAPVKIHLNGTLITGRIDGLDSFQITFRNNIEEGYFQKSYSSELTFYDDGFAILKQELIDSPNALGNEVDVKIFDECCGKAVFEGTIRFDSIDWCEPICSITANVIEKKPDFDCLQSTLITDNHNGFLNTAQKKLRYSVAFRPEALTYAAYLLYFALNVVVTIVTLGTNLIFGYLDNFNARLTLSNWFHPTALLRDYIKNACSKCNLEFQSSILNDASSTYYDTMLFSAPIRKGYKPSQGQNTLITENLPLETIETLMRDHLMPLFNARYWVKDGKLIFERKDFFDAGDVWIDAEAMLVNGQIIDNKICFNYIDKDRPSFAMFTYASDGTDFMAAEAKSRFDNIVEWNVPYSSSQSGKHEVNFLSSQARFRSDKILEDPFNWLASVGPLDALFGNAFSNGLKNLFMSQHTATNYKFLIWDSSSGNDYARVKNDYPDSFVGIPFQSIQEVSDGLFSDVTYNIPLESRFNYPFAFYRPNSPDFPLVDYTKNNLYNDFHVIDHPKVGSSKKFDFNFSFNYDCAQIANFEFTKTVRLRQGNAIKYGEVRELKVDYIKRTVTVIGIV